MNPGKNLQYGFPKMRGGRSSCENKDLIHLTIISSDEGSSSGGEKSQMIPTWSWLSGPMRRTSWLTNSSVTKRQPDRSTWFQPSNSFPTFYQSQRGLVGRYISSHVSWLTVPNLSEFGELKARGGKSRSRGRAVRQVQTSQVGHQLKPVWFELYCCKSYCWKCTK